MANAIYIQKGESLDYVNESESDTIHAGEIVAFGTGIGVAGMDIKPGQSGSLHVVGVFNIPKDTEEIEFGDALYFDADTGTISTNSDCVPCGYAAGYAAAGAPMVPVKIG